MRIVYEPQGRAREYAQLAANLYRGCVHGCLYCYVPAILRTTPDLFRAGAVVRQDALKLLARDCADLAGDPRRVLLSFACDPYQPIESREHVTRQALKLFGDHGIGVDVLTKGGMRAAKDFDLMARYGVRFGTTFVFADDKPRRCWEPYAADTQSRLEAVGTAHAAGIETWVSLEPVIHPDETIEIINRLAGSVDFWWVGKMNHHREIERGIDWPDAADRIEAALQAVSATYRIKDDLQQAREKSS